MKPSFNDDITEYRIKLPFDQNINLDDNNHDSIRSGTDKKYFSQSMRVNHAGEYGACCIYLGQIHGSYNTHKEILSEMLCQEKKHLKYFEESLRINHIKPTILNFVWGKLGYAIGFISAKVDIKIAMLTTDAVETIIEKHYQDQSYMLKKYGYTVTSDVVSQFAKEEAGHKTDAHKYYEFKNLDIFERVYFNMVKLGCKIAIILSKRI